MKSSLPAEYIERMKNLLGEDFQSFIQQYDNPPFRGIRLNLLKCRISHFKAIAPFRLEPTPFAPEGFYLKDAVSGRHPWHHAGLFYFQEPSAMAPVTASGAAPGMKVLDLCAAPGGKSTQLAAKLQGKGLLVSNEIVPSRAKVLASNLERFGVRNAIVLNEKPESVCEKLRGFFDIVLVDAPCSGEGMFRKEPAAAAEWTPDLPRACAKRQLNVLSSARKALSENGVLIYSTCTFSPEENEAVVHLFLKENPDFEMEDIREEFGSGARPDWCGALPDIAKARRIFPQQGGEGHFVARLRRKSSQNGTASGFHYQIDKGARQIFDDFFSAHFHGEIYGRLHEAGGCIYLLPGDMPDLKGLRVLRAGVFAGRIKQNRFEPDHALFMAAQKEEFVEYCDFSLDSPQLAAFLHGEEIEAPRGTMKGYAAVLAQEFPVGYGKVSGGMIKNHYPKGLRNL